ncbi:MOSC domain-containing protein [Marimonas arenosa]|uniref:MOSC domain-containing protein n=1 Tax=Marimonas arenosa TaxID=1795305 RepID=A0AAE3WFE8_9RHOB|nr:sulfurase [Marimonas arenosa]MDQ2092021.1 MOSC domain-containing protein [Marimonas arenosa]
MPALKPTGFYAEITWIGRVADRDAGLQSEPLREAVLDWGGIVGEAHGGVTRPACSRVSAQHPRGTEIRNTGQLSIVSAEDLAAIADDCGLEAIDPAWLGASLVVRGIGDFSLVPPGSQLQGPDGASLVVDMENRPCIYPGQVIEAARPGHGKAFKRAADGRRGVTAWVERPGRMALGNTLRLHVPDQPAWTHLGVARGA